MLRLDKGLIKPIYFQLFSTNYYFKCNAFTGFKMILF